jgi:hypothetical protein
VRVIAVKDEPGAEKLGFEYLDGRHAEAREDSRGQAQAPQPAPQAVRPKGDGSAPRGSVPKVPLVKV